MRMYTIYHPIVMAFYSKDLYRDVAKNWRGIGAIYLLLLVLLAWSPTALFMNRDYQAFLDTDVQHVIDELPTIQVTDGKLSIDKPVPYVISDAETGAPILIIDTSGQITSLEQTSADVLATETIIYYRDRDEPGNIKTFELSEVDDLHLERETVRLWVNRIAPWLILIVIFLGVLVTYIYRILQALIYAGIAMIFNVMFMANLTYQQVLRLTMVAITPAVLLAMLAQIFSIQYPYQLFSYFALSMFYLGFGIAANRGDKKTNQPAKAHG